MTVFARTTEQQAIGLRRPNSKIKRWALGASLRPEAVQDLRPEAVQDTETAAQVVTKMLPEMPVRYQRDTDEILVRY